MWLNTALAQMISENCILLIRQVPYNLSVLLCSPSGGLFFQLAVLHIFWVKKNVPKGRGGRPTCFSQCSPPTAWFLAMLLVENHFKSFLLLFFFILSRTFNRKSTKKQPHISHISVTAAERSFSKLKIVVTLQKTTSTVTMYSWAWAALTSFHFQVVIYRCFVTLLRTDLQWY